MATNPKTATVAIPTTEAVVPAVPTGDKLIAEAVPTEPPPGHALLKPVHTLPRRTRSQMMHMLKQVVAQLPALQQAGDAMPDLPEGTDLDLGDQAAVDGTVAAIGTAADLMDLIADMEDTLAVVAVDETSFRAWSTSAPDDDVMALFMWFANSVGEAKASPS